MFSSFCVDSSLTGADANLVVRDGKLSWSAELPVDEWIISHVPLEKKCLRTVFSLEGKQPVVEVDAKYVTSMKEAMGQAFSYENVPWRYVLPAAEYRRFLTRMVRSVQDALSDVDTTYYEKVFQEVTPLFDMLDYPAIDVPKLESYLNDPKTVNQHTLASFKPFAGSFAKKVVYDRLGTRTGRLKTKAGPDMLTLKKEYRNVVTTRHKEGKVLYVDFASLEARVLLSVAGISVEHRDVYTEIARRLSLSKPRNVVKLIVIATLYGSHHENLSKLSGLSERRITSLMQSIKEMFAIDSLQSKLLSEWRRTGAIRNFFGRKVIIKDESTLINSFGQSTGVDVALLGFHQVVKEMKARELKTKAIFLCHDALIVDAHPSEGDAIGDCLQAGQVIPGMQNTFFLDVSELA